MKRFFKFAGIALAVAMCVTTLVAGVGCSQKDTIAVIAKGETHAFWQAVKKGAQDAGKDYGYRVTFAGPGGESESYVPDQMEKLNAALGNKSTKALVIATIGPGFKTQLASCYDKGIPVVEFDSGLYDNGVDITEGKNPVIGSVATDNSAAAAVVAENFYNYLKTNNKLVAGTTFKLGIIQHDNTQTGIDRQTGFKTKFETLAAADGYTVDIQVDQRTNDDGAYRLALQSLKNKGVNAVYMTNEGVVKEVAAEVSQSLNTYKDILFAGFDCGQNQYDWIMNKGNKYPLLVGSVAQDSYNIGYKSVEMAAKKLKGETFESKVGIAGRWYDSTNIDQLLKDNIFYL